jgi:hypothetical protein
VKIYETGPDSLAPSGSPRAVPCAGVPVCAQFQLGVEGNDPEF